MARVGGTVTGPPGFDELAAGLGERDVRRAVRWLNRSGGLMPLPREAGDLLAVRLAAQIRIFWRLGWPLVAVAVAWLVWGGVPLVRGDDAGFAVVERYGFPGLVCLLALQGWVLDVASARVEARIVASLPRRVVRESRAPVGVVLGRYMTWWAVTALGAVVSFSLVVLALQPGWTALLQTLSVLLLSLQVGAVVARQVRREAVAVDGYSLIVDERLRSERARLGFSVLPMGMWACLPHDRQLYPDLPDSLVMAGYGGMFLLLTTYQVLLLARTWDVPRGGGWISPIRVVDRG